ncbi:MAG: hypothetical protein RR477_08390, partial [Raoultibacter sp.]
MKDKAIYVKWIAILCAVMALFCLAIFVVGYKDLSFGRVATVIALLVVSVACGVASKKMAAAPEKTAAASAKKTTGKRAR